MYHSDYEMIADRANNTKPISLLLTWQTQHAVVVLMQSNCCNWIGRTTPCQHIAAGLQTRETNMLFVDVFHSFGRLQLAIHVLQFNSTCSKVMYFTRKNKWTSENSELLIVCVHQQQWCQDWLSQSYGIWYHPSWSLHLSLLFTFLHRY